MFVLRRYDRNPNIICLFSAYSETVRSTKTCLNGKEAATIFLNNKNSVFRAIKMGWIDETEEYNKILQEEEKKIQKEKKSKRGRKPKKKE